MIDSMLQLKTLKVDAVPFGFLEPFISLLPLHVYKLPVCVSEEVGGRP